MGRVLVGREAICADINGVLTFLSRIPSLKDSRLLQSLQTNWECLALLGFDEEFVRCLEDKIEFLRAEKGTGFLSYFVKAPQDQLDVDYGCARLRTLIQNLRLWYAKYEPPEKLTEGTLVFDGLDEVPIDGRLFFDFKQWEAIDDDDDALLNTPGVLIPSPVPVSPRTKG